jgi:transposase-like protein
MEKNQNQNSKRSRRSYDESFKASAVKLIQTGRTVSDVSKSLGIEPQLLTRWVKQSELVPKVYISEQSVPPVSEQSVPPISEQSVPPISEQSVPPVSE